MDKKIWKVWDNHSDLYQTWDFTNYNDLTQRNHFDFYYREIFDWEFSNTKCIYEMSECIIKDDDIVIDFGSNIGLFTKYAAEKCKKVISIEGSPEYFSCLVENTSENKNIFYLNANIVGENNKDIGTWSGNPSKLKLTIKDIFFLYDLEYIDFLKIDIEGGEYSIFENLDDTYLKRIKKIAIETHNKDLNSELIERICSVGKNIYYFNWFHGPEEPQTMLYFY